MLFCHLCHGILLNCLLDFEFRLLLCLIVWHLYRFTFINDTKLIVENSTLEMYSLWQQPIAITKTNTNSDHLPNKQKYVPIL